MKQYNGLAETLFKTKPDMVLSDLYSAVIGVCGEFDTGYCALQNRNDIHFTSAGRQFSAVVVAHAVAPLLGPKWASLTKPK